MLDNLVESKNNSRAVRKTYGFLLSTFFVLCTMLLSATVWSLFAKDFGVGNSDFELSDLINPIPIANTKPEPEPEKTKPQNAPQSSKPQIAVRQANMARVDESQIVPDKVSVAPNTQKARPNAPFLIRPNGVETEGTSDNGRKNNGTSEPTGFKQPADDSEIVSETVKTKVPAPPPVLKKEEKPKATTVSLGVINGKASNLPKPPYPAPAKAVGASGTVQVQVLIDENGNVVSAKAVNGHPLLRDAAERAAKSARFTPTLLSNVPVKVNGLIVYNFTK